MLILWNHNLSENCRWWTWWHQCIDTNQDSWNWQIPVDMICIQNFWVFKLLRINTCFAIFLCANIKMVFSLPSFYSHLTTSLKTPSVEVGCNVWSLHNTDPMIWRSDTIFFPFFLVAVFWYCFLVTAAIKKLKV